MTSSDASDTAGAAAPLRLVAYTDGACSGNPGPGGWGVLVQAKRGEALVKERELCGRPISKFQAIQFYLADMTTDIDAGRLLTWKAAWAHDHRKRFTLEAAQAKLFTAEMAQRVTTRALQIHGGYGYTREYNVERYFRDARITEIYEGTSEIQKMVIGSWVLENA